MRVIAIIQARLGSSRLPGKILQQIDGKPMLAHVIKAAQDIEDVERIYVAVPPADLEAVNHALVQPRDVYAYLDEMDRTDVVAPAVPEDDVLARFAAVVEGWPTGAIGLDAILRLTADCPFLDPRVCEKVLQRFTEESADYASNDTTQSGYPDGLDCEVFTRALLERANRECLDPYDREHVTSGMKRLQGARIVLVRNETPGDQTKLSVDTAEDLERVRARKGD